MKVGVKKFLKDEILFWKEEWKSFVWVIPVMYLLFVSATATSYSTDLENSVLAQMEGQGVEAHYELGEYIRLKTQKEVDAPFYTLPILYVFEHDWYKIKKISTSSILPNVGTSTPMQYTGVKDGMLEFYTGKNFRYIPINHAVISFPADEISFVVDTINDDMSIDGRWVKD